MEPPSSSRSVAENLFVGLAVPRCRPRAAGLACFAASVFSPPAACFFFLASPPPCVHHLFFLNGCRCHPCGTFHGFLLLMTEGIQIFGVTTSLFSAANSSFLDATVSGGFFHRRHCERLPIFFFLVDGLIDKRLYAPLPRHLLPPFYLVLTFVSQRGPILLACLSP